MGFEKSARYPPEPVFEYLFGPVEPVKILPEWLQADSYQRPSNPIARTKKVQ